MDYYIARWYDPVTGHFTSADTIIPEPGKASAFDRYGYVSNNPMRNNDPSGNRPCDDQKGDNKCITYPKDWGKKYKEPENKKDRGSKLSLAFTSGIGPAFTYASLDIIQDEEGMVATYITYRDMDYHSDNPLTPDLSKFPDHGKAEKYLMGVAKFLHITDDYGNSELPAVTPQIGVAITGGYLYGEDFTINGVDSYKGPALQISATGSIIGGDIYTAYDPKNNMPKTTLYGWDAGLSLGKPDASASIIATYNYQLNKFKLPSIILIFCTMTHGCGG